MRVFVGLGSNIHPRENLRRAVTLLEERSRLVAVSPVYRTAAVGRSDLPPFLNAAVELSDARDPAELKYALLRPIEAELGRVRTADRAAPRTIDLDLLLVDGLVLDDPGTGITLPDPEILERPHLALPLADLAPDLVHPTDGRTLAEVAKALSYEAEPECRPLAGWSATLARPRGAGQPAAGARQEGDS
ncbi:MAG: 2-amino-4-hydroxy-6-hydroxymethyldihydropteridine diphosphokinase [Thermoanaerobaculia bacterium]